MSQTLSERSGSVCSFRSTTFPITATDGSERLFRSAESLLLFKCVFLSLLSELFLSALLGSPLVDPLVSVTANNLRVLLGNLLLGKVSPALLFEESSGLLIVLDLLRVLFSVSALLKAR